VKQQIAATDSSERVVLAPTVQKTRKRQTPETERPPQADQNGWAGLWPEQLALDQTVESKPARSKSAKLKRVKLSHPGLNQAR
jgi:hypothetical protein